MENKAPSSIRSGDSVSWTQELPEYSAGDGWSLKYRIIPIASGRAPVSISSAGTGNTYTVSLTAAVTSLWQAGIASLVSFVERGSGPSLERITLDVKVIEILPSLISAKVHDSRGNNVIALENARAALSAYMAKGQAHVLEYDIAGRRMKFRSADDIISLIAHYEKEVAKENALKSMAQGGAGGRIVVRF